MFSYVNLAPEKKALLDSYVALLLQEGDRLGLTAFRTAEPIWNELITDSASAATSLPLNGQIVDLGSGGGCPGIVLQILRPDTIFYLLESNGRKASFLRQTVEHLQLPSVILQERSEIVAHKDLYRARFDMVVAKAVAHLSVLVELSLPLLKLQGRLLAYKGPQAHQEIDEASKALQLLHGHLYSSKPYDLAGKTYYHVIIEKMSETPPHYPRRPGIPAKQPLK